MATNPRVDQFLRQNAEFIDTDEQGNPVDFEQKDGADGTIIFTITNNGEKVTYEARPGRPIRPTLAYQGRKLEKGKRAEAKKPSNQGANGGPKEREKKLPSEPSEPTQQAGTVPSQSEPVSSDDKPTYFEQYLRLARTIIEG